MQNFTQRYLEKKDNEILNFLGESFVFLLTETGADFSNSPHFDTMETAIAQIQEKHDVEVNLLKIQKAINAEFKTNCSKVFITENRLKGEFFGAHIIPTENECYKMIDNVIKIKENVKFEKCSEFVIELDSKLVYDLKATPQEIVAVLLHEIGHKVFYTKHRTRMKAKFLEVIASNGVLVGGAVALGGLVTYKFLLITLILNYFNSCFCNILSLKDEIDSDSFAVQFGYGVHLHSVITKIIDNSRAFGSMRIGRNKEKEDKAIAEWCFKSMLDFTLRKKHIRKDLEMMLRSETNPEVVKLIKSQINSLDTVSKRTKGLNSVKMNLFSNGAGVVSNKSESFSSFAEMNAKGISYLELDEISVEIDRIRDHEDKLYVMSRIHKNLADNGKFIQRKEKDLAKKKLSDSQIRDNVEMKELMAYRSQLLDLLQRCRSIKPREKHHHFIVGYPVGYEG